MNNVMSILHPPCIFCAPKEEIRAEDSSSKSKTAEERAEQETHRRRNVGGFLHFCH